MILHAAFATVPMAKAAKPGVDAALAIIRGAIAPLGVERVAIGDALDRLLAAPVAARLDVPRFDCSAMDGYALSSAAAAHATHASPACFVIVAPVHAGDTPPPLGPQQAAGISTGAPIPAGADAVLVIERAVIGDEGQLVLRDPIPAGANLRRRGEDVHAAVPLIAADVALDPEAIGLLAAAGVSAVDVRRQPRLAYLSTGDELALPGAADLDCAAIMDSNRPMIAAMAQRAGLPFSSRHATPDDPDAIIAALRELSSDADIMITSGGASAGTADFTRDAIEALGGEVLFHGIDMRPGKPLLFARLPGGQYFFGLPGNPIAALVGFRFFVSAAIRALLGLPPEAGTPVAWRRSPAGKPDLFLRVRTSGTGNDLRIDASLDQRSHILSSAVTADGWLHVHAESDSAVLFEKAMRCR